MAKDVVIHVRITEDEYSSWRMRARGQGMSAFVRDVVNGVIHAESSGEDGSSPSEDPPLVEQTSGVRSVPVSEVPQAERVKANVKGIFSEMGIAPKRFKGRGKE